MKSDSTSSRGIVQWYLSVKIHSVEWVELLVRGNRGKQPIPVKLGFPETQVVLVLCGYKIAGFGRLSSRRLCGLIGYKWGTSSIYSAVNEVRKVFDNAVDGGRKIVQGTRPWYFLSAEVEVEVVGQINLDEKGYFSFLDLVRTPDEWVGLAGVYTDLDEDLLRKLWRVKYNSKSLQLK